MYGWLAGVAGAEEGVARGGGTKTQEQLVLCLTELIVYLFSLHRC
jgi:hypothetical protein